MHRDAFGLWACRRILLTLRDGGARETTSLIRKNLAESARQHLNRRFDWWFHVDTSGIIQLSDVTCDSNNKAFGVWYEPTPIRTLRCMFSLLPNDVSDYTFIDFGSGKGRTILYASNCNFRRIIGVEFAKELHAVAKRNIHTYRSKRQQCFDITSVCLDAVNFSIPEEKLVLYFFHPFKREVMTQVLGNIEQSYLRNPRKLIVLYYHPQVNSVIQGLTCFRKREEKVMPCDLSGQPCPYRRKLEVYETSNYPA